MVQKRRWTNKLLKKKEENLPQDYPYLINIIKNV